MRFTTPFPVLDGHVVGFDPSTNEVLWRFGYLEGSNHARAHGVHVDAFLWVVADRLSGEITATFSGFAMNLPKEFNHIILTGDPVDEQEEGDWRDGLGT